MGDEFWLKICGLRVVVNGLMLTSCGLRGEETIMWLKGCGQRVVVNGLLLTCYGYHTVITL